MNALTQIIPLYVAHRLHMAPTFLSQNFRQEGGLHGYATVGSDTCSLAILFDDRDAFDDFDLLATLCNTQSIT